VCASKFTLETITGEIVDYINECGDSEEQLRGIAVLRDFLGELESSILKAVFYGNDEPNPRI